MYKICICRSVGRTGSVVSAEGLVTLVREELPDDLESLVELYGGDCYEITEEEE